MLTERYRYYTETPSGATTIHTWMDKHGIDRHRKTALDTIKTRVEAANYRGMRTVTTFHGFVNWFNHGTDHFDTYLRAAHNNRTTIPPLTID